MVSKTWFAGVYCMLQYDFAIVGGGMVGASLALALARLKAPGGREPRILLLEAQGLNFGHHPGFDARAIALSYGSERILTSLGLWAAFSQSFSPITSIHVSDRTHFGRVELNCSEFRIPRLGGVVELQHAGAALYELMAQCPAIECVAPSCITQLIQQPDHVVLSTTDRQYQARLLLLADGAQSPWREQLRIPVQEDAFDQSAVIANVEVSGAHPGRAWERFTSGGPLALLPMSGRRLSLVWCQSHAAAHECMKMSPTSFLDHLQREVGFRAGHFTQVGARHLYPLVLRYAQERYRHRTLLMGNSAHQLHPVAGQGFNLAVRGIAELVSTMQLGWSDHQDPGALALLQQYVQGREADVMRTISMTSTLARLFTTSTPSVVMGRTLLLGGMNRTSCFKQWFAEQALGMRE